ncbi:MAG: hypothetical protein HOW73_46800 [Polyangiaceae bacterium]|nr:hypothetical protein [Polyangiaceae bacterium]
MKHRFEVVYSMDTTLGCAVAAYLDAEHYAFLHSKYSPHYEVVRKEGRTIRIRQTWTYGGVRIGQSCTTEYAPPARFLNYDIEGLPVFLPSVHHLVKTRTELFYYPDATGTKTISHLVVDLDVPAPLAMLVPTLERKMVALKKEKDLEDMEMIFRRERLFGRGNIRGYLADHQFMLHKDDFVHHFGSPDAERRAGELALEVAPTTARREGVPELGI